MYRSRRGLAATNLMLAAQGLGYESCPMIGFDPGQVSDVRGLDTKLNTNHPARHATTTVVIRLLRLSIQIQRTQLLFQQISEHSKEKKDMSKLNNKIAVVTGGNSALVSRRRNVLLPKEPR